jgi:thioredoxin 1
MEEVNFMNYESKVDNGLVLMEFWADWCESCKIQKQFLHNIEDKYKSNLKMLSLNVGENKYLSQKLGVRNIPALLLFKSGEQIARLDNLQSQELIELFINKYIKDEK